MLQVAELVAWQFASGCVELAVVWLALRASVRRQAEAGRVRQIDNGELETWANAQTSSYEL